MLYVNIMGESEPEAVRTRAGFLQLRLKRKGQLVKMEDGSQALLNEKGKRYRVSPQIIDLWNRCDGNMYQHELVPKFGPQTYPIVKKLTELELLEIIKD